MMPLVDHNIAGHILRYPDIILSIHYLIMSEHKFHKMYFVLCIVDSVETVDLR